MAALVVTAFTLVGASQGNSANADELVLEQLVSQVRTRNASATAAVRRLEAARMAIPRARALPEPAVEMMVEEVPTKLSGGMPMFRFQARQMFPWFGKRDRMAAVAAHEADARAAQADVTMLDVVAEGKRLYFQLLLNREARRINRQQREVIDTVVTIATVRLRSGTGMHHDVLKMQTEAAMVDDELIMLEADRTEMAGMLNALLDRSADAPVAEPREAWTPIRPLTRAGLVAAAIDRRPELRAMTAMVGAERAMAAAARREYYPDFMLGLIYDLRMDEPDALGGMVGLNIPLWIGSRQRLDVRAAEARALAFERDRVAMAGMARTEIERQLARLEASQRRGDLLDSKFVPLAQQTFDSALAAFPSGTVDALELLDALRALFAQRLARTGVRIQRELALVELERVTGVPLEEIAP
ncbi:MAG TPA: TolC family protein [Polyangia bacterium]